MLTKERNNTINQYILDCIDAEGYGETLTTNKEKCQFLYKTFKSEYGWMIERIGEQRAMKEWFHGLPSCFNLAFTNHDIIQLAKKWESIPQDATEKQEDKILENYWNLMAYKTITLIRKNMKG